MNAFNIYRFMATLERDIKNGRELGYINNSEDVENEIESHLENATIYYSDCFDICKELGLSYFKGYSLGDANNISQLAYFGLWEYVYQNLSMLCLNSKLDELSDEFIN